MRTSPFLLLAFAAVAVAAAPLRGQCSVFANTPPGTNLGLREEGLRTVPLGFNFRFANAVYDRVTISDNGYVWLGAAPTSGGSDFSPTAAEMLSQAPRLSPCWFDLHSDSVLVPPGGGVFFRSDNLTANIVWKGIPRFFHQPVFANMEIVLTADTHPTNRNSIAFVYDASMMPMTGTNIVGITVGNNAPTPPATQPPGVAWTAFVPGTVVGSTAYQVFTAPTGATPFNLVGQTLQFTPTDPNTAFNFGVSIAPLGTCPPLTSYPLAATEPVAYGVGCPAPLPPGAIYESFTTNTGTSPFDLANQSIAFIRNGNSYAAVPGLPVDTTFATTGTQLTGNDDAIVNVTFGAMGSFPFGAESLTSVSACTNGFVWMGTNTGTSFSPTSAALLSEMGRVAAYWTDLNSGTTGGGTWWWENNNTSFCRLTYDNVREFNQATSGNTAQITFFSTGDIYLSYGTTSGGIANPVMVGISGGGGAVDSGSFDFVANGNNNITSRAITPQAAMVHTLAGPCQLGLGFTMRSTVPAPLSGLGVFIIGAVNPAAPLDSLGAPGCSLYATLDNMFFTTFASSPMTTTLPVPPNPALSGVQFFSQAAALSTLNAFGIIASNGQQFALGI